MLSRDWIVPGWPAPANVGAISTTRSGGVSEGDYASLNLGSHVGDAPSAVARNRQILRDALELDREPAWVQQVHGCDAVSASSAAGCPRDADAVFSRSPGETCVVMTADCLPVLFCDVSGSVVASAHAGWRGLAAGVLENTLRAMDVAPGEIMAWMGPAIGPEVFEVGDEVREAFMRVHAEAHQAFRSSPADRWLADIYQLARLRLESAGLQSVHGGGFCTYSDEERFFSYRRHATTGRMASLIWLKS